MKSIFSIGHSNSTIEHFVKQLKANKVSLVADVRSSPFSRYCPWFSKNMLVKYLEAENIAYVFLGDSLGGRPSDRVCYDSDGILSYELMLESSSFRKGIDVLLKLYKDSDKTLAFMCSEENPVVCHRGLLISRALSSKGLEVFHIRKDSGILSNSDLYEYMTDQANKKSSFPEQVLDEFMVYKLMSSEIEKKTKFKER